MWSSQRRAGVGDWVDATIATLICVHQGQEVVSVLMIHENLVGALQGTFPGLWYMLTLFYTTSEVAVAYAICQAGSTAAQVARWPLSRMQIPISLQRVPF